MIGLGQEAWRCVLRGCFFVMSEGVGEGDLWVDGWTQRSIVSHRYGMESVPFER